MKIQKKHSGVGIIGRREALSRFMLGSFGLFIGCAPIKSFDSKSGVSGTQRETNILGAFMETIVPGLQVNQSDLTSVFYDNYYQYSKLRRILVKDLINQTKKMFGVKTFEILHSENRKKIIQHVLAVGGIMKKVYVGAIYLTQIAAYSGFCNRDQSSSIIDFKAEYGFEPNSYRNYKDFLGENQTIDGNYS